jgi:DNA polymerase III epsilon subunit-like protein
VPKADVYISVDIEADGPIPGDFSMSSLGAVVVGSPEQTFYRELRPISDRFDPAAASVSGLDRAKLVADGADPAATMRDFAAWLNSVSAGGRPVLVAFNATFDWMFVHWYFVHFVGRDPFGISGLDIKAYYMGALGKDSWADTTKRNLESRFRSELPHSHNALDDALEQAEVFAKIKAWAERTQGDRP